MSLKLDSLTSLMVNSSRRVAGNLSPGNSLSSVFAVSEFCPLCATASDCWLACSIGKLSATSVEADWSGDGAICVEAASYGHLYGSGTCGLPGVAEEIT